MRHILHWASCSALKSVVLVSGERTTEGDGGDGTSGGSGCELRRYELLLVPGPWEPTCGSGHQGMAFRAGVYEEMLRIIQGGKRRKKCSPETTLAKSPSAFKWGMSVHTALCLSLSGAMLWGHLPPKIQKSNKHREVESWLLQPCSERCRRAANCRKRQRCLPPLLLLPPWLLRTQLLCPCPDT